MLRNPDRLRIGQVVWYTPPNRNGKSRRVVIWDTKYVHTKFVAFLSDKWNVVGRGLNVSTLGLTLHKPRYAK